MFDLISIGDTRIDNFIKIEDAHVMCNLNKTTCELCFKFGTKIPVQEFKSICAGNNSNNAVGAARLNLNTALYAYVGEDAQGERIIDHLKKEGVSTKYIMQPKGWETELSTIVSFKGERTIFVYHQQWEYKLPDLDKSKWLYLSSVSASFVKHDLVGQIINYVERSGAKLAFNPGTFQLRAGVKKFPRLLSLAKIMFVNVEEAKLILGYRDEENVPIKKLLKQMQELGPEKVVITDGPNGSYATDGEKNYKLGIFPAKVVDMTGAGDAYSTGCLAALFHNKELPEAMRWGAVNGAACAEEIGPQAGLLTYNKMQEKLKENAKIIAKEI